MSDPYSIQPSETRPKVPDAPQVEPLQIDPTLNGGHTSTIRVAASIIGTGIVVLLVLFAMTRESQEPPIAAAPPAATSPQGNGQPPQANAPAPGAGQGASEQGTTGVGPTNRSRPGPIPQEQDQIEQNTRP